MTRKDLDRIVRDEEREHGPHANATPSTHPKAAELQARLAKVIAPATHAADVRVIVQILGDHRGLGTPNGEERVRLVTRLYAALTDMRIKVDLEDLLGAFGAGPWEKT